MPNIDIRSEVDHSLSLSLSHSAGGAGRKGKRSGPRQEAECHGNCDWPLDARSRSSTEHLRNDYKR